jgi:hypothetical protein
MPVSANSKDLAHGIEEALDIRVQHPVHRFPVDPGMEGVQRVVLAPSRPEAVREAQEVHLVDRLQNKHHRLLDDLVFQAQDTERPLRAVAFEC